MPWRVLDLYLYGKDVLDRVARHPKLKQICGDLAIRPSSKRRSRVATR